MGMNLLHLIPRTRSTIWLSFSMILRRSMELSILENELSTHDPFAHIGQQLLKFAISYKASGRKIKEFLLNKIIKDAELSLNF